MVTRRKINFGVIGCGLMGREFASAAARWNHLSGLDYEPVITAACDPNPAALAWFEDNNPHLRLATADYRAVLADPDIEAVYIAVQHNLHERMYIDAIQAGKHLLGEKPFGIDQPANQAILETCSSHPDVLVRCSSEFPFYPGAYRMAQWMREGRFGQIIEVEAGFWHSSDLDPRKPINWKRIIATCGEYGCMGDLGMHVVHLPFRAGWFPSNLRALLSKVVSERPGPDGRMTPCETWDNAILACEVDMGGQHFPMTLSTKRIAPGHGNTWFIRVYGTSCSAEFSTKNPKQLATLPYSPGDAQAWQLLDMPYLSAYPAITGPIFEFGFSDAILQMWAAFCDELVHGREGMRQPFVCATPTETGQSHRLFTAALESHRLSSVISL
jgi:predicted dehydrogenase